MVRNPLIEGNTQMEKTTLKLNDVTLFWSKHSKLDELSGKYQVELAKLNDKQVARLKELGIPLKNKGDDRGDFIKVASKFPITMFDSDGNDLSETAIGNGSTASVYCYADPYKVGTNSGVAMRINRVYVQDLIGYSDGAVDEEL